MKLALTILLFSLGQLASAHLSGFLMRRRHKVHSVNTNFFDTTSDKWFKQMLDHSDPTNPQTWWQRYQYSNAWFRPGTSDPVFLTIGGEGEAPADSLFGSAMMSYAEKHHALCFQLEHRFYGKSQPTENLSVENLRYLSSEQALGDIASFITGMNDKFNLKNNKWVLFGGSYAGSLVAWTRMRYPHLIHAAVSSSAPLLAQENFKGYLQVVKKVLDSFKSCAQNAHLAALQVNQMLETSKGAETIAKKFKLCSPIDMTNKNEVSTLKVRLAGNIAIPVQYNKNSDLKVDKLCSVMNDKTLGSLIDRYAAVGSMASIVPQCIDATYFSYIQDLKNTSYSTSSGGRQWMYQTCTEFGFFQTSGSNNDMFGSAFNLQYYIDQCKDSFGEDFDQNRLRSGIARTNVKYGALNIKVDRVVFVHGTGDPWHVLGMNSSNNPESPTILIQGGSHCDDTDPPSSDDSKQLIAARNEIDKLLTKWLST